MTIGIDGIASEGEKLEDVTKEDQEEKDPAESSTEKEEDKKETEEEKTARETKEQEEEDKLPFHKHPRFKALIGERNDFKLRAEKTEQELEKFKGEVDSKISEIKESRSENTQKPKWFVEAFGENEEAWAGFTEMNKEMRAEVTKEIREDMKKEQEEKDGSAKKWNDWIDNEINSLKEEGLKFDKNELMKVMEEFKPSDDKGNLNFRRGYEILEMQKKKDPEKSKARKELADNSEDSKAEPTKKEYKTPEDMKGVGW